MSIGRLAWGIACAALCLAVTVVGAAVGIAGGVWHVLTSRQQVLLNQLLNSGPPSLSGQQYVSPRSCIRGQSSQQRALCYQVAILLAETKSETRHTGLRIVYNSCTRS